MLTRRLVASTAVVFTTLLFSGCASSEPATLNPSSGEMPSPTTIDSRNPPSFTPTTEAPATTTASSPVARQNVTSASCPITADQAHDIAGAPAHLRSPRPASDTQVRCEYGIEPGINAQGEVNTLDYPYVTVRDISQAEFDISERFNRPDPIFHFKYSPELGPGAWETWAENIPYLGDSAQVQMPWQGKYITVGVTLPPKTSPAPGAAHAAVNQLAKLIAN
jgi:hypothetical protein